MSRPIIHDYGYCCHCGAEVVYEKMYEHTNGDGTCGDCKKEYIELLEEEEEDD